MRTLILTFGLLAGVTPALASGGISCAGEDGPAKIALSAGVTRGMGGPIFQLAATTGVADETVAEDLRKSTFTKENIAQYWFDDKEMKLLLYREREGEPFGSVQLFIGTQPVGDDIGYDGDFKLTISDMADSTTGEAKVAEFTGKISCSVE